MFILDEFGPRKAQIEMRYILYYYVLLYFVYKTMSFHCAKYKELQISRKSSQITLHIQIIYILWTHLLAQVEKEQNLLHFSLRILSCVLLHLHFLPAWWILVLIINTWHTIYKSTRINYEDNRSKQRMKTSNNWCWPLKSSFKGGPRAQ